MYFAGDEGFASLGVVCRMCLQTYFCWAFGFLVSRAKISMRQGIATWRGSIHGWVWTDGVMGEQHCEGLEVRNAGHVGSMDFRTRQSHYLGCFMPTEGSWCEDCQIRCAGWVPSGQWCSACPCPSGSCRLPVLNYSEDWCGVALRQLQACGGSDWGTLPPCDRSVVQAQEHRS